VPRGKNDFFDPRKAAYEALELNLDANREDIDSSFKRLALELHPINNAEQAPNFERICRAYATLVSRADRTRDKTLGGGDRDVCPREVFCEFVTSLPREDTPDDWELIRLLQLTLENDNLPGLRKERQFQSVLDKQLGIRSKKHDLSPREPDCFPNGNSSSSPSLASSSSPPLSGLSGTGPERESRNHRKSRSKGKSVPDPSIEQASDSFKSESLSYAGVLKKNLTRSPSTSSISSHAGGSSLGAHGSSGTLENPAILVEPVPTVVIQQGDSAARVSYRWWKKGVLTPKSTTVSLPESAFIDLLDGPAVSPSPSLDPKGSGEEGELGRTWKLAGEGAEELESQVRSQITDSDANPILSAVAAAAFRALYNKLPHSDQPPLNSWIGSSSSLQLLERVVQASRDKDNEGSNSCRYFERSWSENIGIHYSSNRLPAVASSTTMLDRPRETFEVDQLSSLENIESDEPEGFPNGHWIRLDHSRSRTPGWSELEEADHYRGASNPYLDVGLRWFPTGQRS